MTCTLLFRVLLPKNGYIKETAKCKTANLRNEIKGYLSLREYADDRDIELDKLKRDVIRGVYTTAKKVSNRWYIKETEKCKPTETKRGRKSKKQKKSEKEYISVSAYAKLHSFSAQKIRRDIENGLYETATRKGSRWYIDKHEPCKSVDNRKKNT